MSEGIKLLDYVSRFWSGAKAWFPAQIVMSTRFNSLGWRASRMKR